jgi:hypothetical protein
MPFQQTSGTNPDDIYETVALRLPAWGVSWGVSWGSAWGIGSNLTIYGETSGTSLEEIYEEN